jgi:hypothetical protein
MQVCPFCRIKLGVVTKFSRENGDSASPLLSPPWSTGLIPGGSSPGEPLPWLPFFHLLSCPPLDLQSRFKLQLEIWNKFWLPVSFSKEFSQKEFLLIASFGHCKHRLDLTRWLFFFKRQLVDCWWISMCCSSPIRSFDFWSPTEKWVSLSINCNISNAIALKFISICGIMVEPIGKKNSNNIRLKKMILGRLYRRKNSALLMLLKRHR